MAKIVIGGETEELVLVILGKEYSATKVNDFPIKMVGEINALAEKMQSGDQSAVDEFLIKCIPGLTSEVIQEMSPRQLNHLSIVLGGLDEDDGEGEGKEQGSG